jgi:putative ABC transport system permease protein
MKFIIPRIALRNLSRQKKRSFLLGGAIAFGIMIVTLINGFAGAFIENVSENFSYLMAGHVFVQGAEKTASGKRLSVIRDDSIIFSALRDSGLDYEFATKTSEVSASLYFEGKTIRQTLTALIWPPTLPARTVCPSPGLWDTTARSIILSEKIASRLNVLPETDHRQLPNHY